MDALTHAIESYMGGWSTAYTRNLSLAAIGKIFANVQKSYHDGKDMDAREAMLQASFEAGVAFTRANVGYVHAIAHQLGGMFHTPHGDANAMILPYILDYYLQEELTDDADKNTELKCCTQCCEMAVAGGLASWVPTDVKGKQELAKAFVAKIKQMNAEMSIPKDVPSMKANQVNEVATRALAEAHGEQHGITSAPLEFLLDLGYPTPKYMTLDDCESIVRKFLPAGEA
jgi:alcohol dehydrogenase class IV